MKFQTPGVVVEVALHVATLLAVVIVYRGVLWDLTKGVMARERASWRYVILLLVGTIPAGVVGITLEDFFERAFQSPALVGVNFLVTGVVLWSTRGLADRARRQALVTGDAVGVGFAQALAIFPGISRSGTTVAAAQWLGIDPVRAAEFSFLLLLPAIAGAAVLQVPDLAAGGVEGVAWGALGVGFVAALVSGVAAIRLLIALLRRRAFHRFAPYCWTLGLVTIGWAWLIG